MMKRIISILMLLVSFSAFSQVVIPTEAEIDLTAELKVYSTNRGVLIPRLPTLKINAMPEPAEGLWVYNSTLNVFYIFDSAYWIRMDQALSDIANPTVKYVGEYYFNTLDNKIRYWNGTSWVTVGTL